MTDESAPSTETGIRSPEDARRIVSDAASRYFESRRSRVDAFVDRHFSLVGSAAIHRKAVGWDMLKAPANIALAVPQLATKLAAAGAKAVGAGAVAVKQATPGVMTLGPALAAALAQQAAVASFPLGASAGSLWYGIFPAAASPVLIGGVTGGLLAVSSIAAAFAGILADPVQRKLGLHQRRLHRLIDALERQWNAERQEAGFVARDPYVARLLDLFDLLGSAYRLAKA